MKIEVVHGNIAQEKMDAIVNAANSSLMGGGGVDGAIHKAAGPQVLDECRAISLSRGGCPTGQAVFTSAGSLAAKYVIHAVGPVWKGGSKGEDDLLAAAYRSAFRIGEELRVKSIAFPNISTGIYGFPPVRAARVVDRTVHEILPTLRSVEHIRFVCFEEENYNLYLQLFPNDL